MKKTVECIKNKRLFILDMDGTFYLGEKIIDGSLCFIDKLREKGKNFLFFTNNSSKTSYFYKDKLSRMGCEVDTSQIVTSGDVTIKYLKKNYPHARVFLIGTSLLEESFRQSGITLVQDNPDIVIAAFDTSFTYEKISKACKHIRMGAKFIATHPDINCPTEDGFIPDCGALCSMITASTGVKPKYLGKPYRETLDAIKDLMGYEKEDMVFIGDRLYTDIAIGFNNNVLSILVLSGETTIKDLEHSDVQPDFVFTSLAEVAEFL